MKNNKKLYALIFILLLSFSLFLYFVFRPYNYKKKYVIQKYVITEEYNKKDKYYLFYIEYENITYPFIIESKYTRNRKLIKDIKVLNNENEKCILPISDEINFYPLCSNKENIYTYKLAKNSKNFYEYKKETNKNIDFKNIQIRKINNFNYLLYNYKGFYLINKSTKKTIELFDKDVYTINLIYQLDNFILIADYNENYYYSKLYLINILNGKVKEINSEYDISFESRFLGDYNKHVYLLDTKEKKEYKINIKKETIENIEYQMLVNNKIEKVKYKELQEFNIANKKYSYLLKNNILYHKIDDIEIQITDKSVDKVISSTKDSVYYLSEENLYMYNNIEGEVLLITNFEWNFNNTNMIFLYR